MFQDKLKEQDEDENKYEIPTDTMFIWRTIMVILSCLFAAAGVIMVGVDYGMHTIKPVHIKKNVQH